MKTNDATLDNQKVGKIRPYGTVRRKMESKDQIINAVEKLSLELNKKRRNSEIARFVSRELEVLKKSNGLTFPYKLEYFFNNAPAIKLLDEFVFSKREKSLWDCVFAYKQLGNYSWIVSE